MRGRSVHLTFDDFRIDDLAAVVNDSVIENVGNAGGGINFHHGDMKLSGVGER